MTTPYGLISDQHCHAWNAFSTLDKEGRNSRLMSILHEIDRCSDEVLRVGGNRVVFGGDLFHVRGSVDPSVFNPVKECMRRNWGRGIYFDGISGNHDLQSRESEELGSSVAMLNGVSNRFRIRHEAMVIDRLAVVPWHSKVEDYLIAIAGLVESIKAVSKSSLALTDLICHIGIEGTLDGVPGNGVTATQLASYGFRRVFSGHYHNHKDFENGVYSIGATTHQTWSDVGTKAGFMIVYPDRVRWFASHAPSFIDLAGDEAIEDLPLIVDGHYVRAQMGTATNVEVQAMRANLLSMGAAGVLVSSTPVSSGTKRIGVTPKVISNIDKSVADYVNERKENAEVLAICSEILTEVRS